MKKLLSLLMILTFAGVGNVWADTTIKTVNFTTETWTGATINDGSTIDDCYIKGAGTTATSSDGLAFNNNMKVSNYYVAIPLTNINGSVTVTIEGQSRPSLRYALTSNVATLASVTDIARPSSGNTVTFTISDISGTSTYLCLGRNGSGNTIKTVTVTTPDAASLTQQTISIEDLYIEHLTYNPSRSNIAGFNITTSGWQSQTTTGSPNTYSLLLSQSSLSDNSITISTNSDNSARKIKQIVLVGANSNGTFTNTTPSSSDTYSTENRDQIVWRNETGTNSVTINLTATDRPAISEIWVFTDAATTWSKQNVNISYSTNTSAVGINSSEVNLDYPTTSPANFRLNYTFNANGTVATGEQHLSKSKYGITPGGTAGTATVTATAPESTFFNANTIGDTYSLIISDNSLQSKTITIDDMRFSKTANEQGISAGNNGLDRRLGGFDFTFTDGTNGGGVKYINGDGIIIRNKEGFGPGVITITPVKSNNTKVVKIKRVDISTYPSSDWTNGEFTISGLGSNQTIKNVSSYTFDNLNSGNGVDAFSITAVSGIMYIRSFTIYYTDTENTLNTENVTPTITFSKASDNIAAGGNYNSPTITTSPANFDISASSDNTDVATVSLTNWTNNGTLVSLQGASGTANVTASATASTFFKAATNATYAVTVAEASSEESEKWNFTTLNVANTITNDTGWNGGSGWSKSGDYYQNSFTSSDNSTQSAYTPASPSQLQLLKFGRKNSSGLGTGQIRLYSSYMQFRNTAIWVDIPVTSVSDKVTVTFDGGNGSTQAGFDIFNATVEGDATTTAITSDDTQTTITLEATADAVTAGYVRLQCTKSNVKLYRIQVSTETRGTLTMRDTSNSYEKNVGTGTTSATDNHFNHRVLFTPSDALTYENDATKITVTSTDPTVLNVSNCYIMQGSFGQSSSFYIGNIIPKKAGTAELIISFAGNNEYKPTSYTSQTYTVYGPTKFLVQVEDQDIQQGQFSLISPIITDTLGRAIGIKEMTDGSGRYTTYVLDEDEAIPDYSNYFNFTYTPGEGSGENYDKITMDGTIANKVLTEDDSTNPATAAAVGAYRKITVSATPISNYQSAFSTGSTAVTNTATMTIIEKTKNPQFHLFWDAGCTDTYKITETGTDATTGAETWKLKSTVAEQNASKQWLVNQGAFADGFPNGRMLYVQPVNPGDSIWFSYEQNDEASTIPANPSINKNKRIFEYRRGIPIYIDDDLGTDDYVTVNIVATSWNASTKKRNLNGSVARLKFPKIIAHTRPAEPTYDPVSPAETAAENKDGRRIMNTSENVVAYGEGASKNVTGQNNLVYGKFSTSSVYTTEQLINEKTVSYGRDNVPVVSTEVAKRRFTAVQIKTESEGNDYISMQTYTEYWYLYDTDLRITPERYDISVNPNNAGNPTTTGTPSYTVTWYNKKTGKNQEVDSYDSKITYTEAGRNGATGATLNADGTVSAGANPGWVRVKITYTGGEQHGGVSGEPQYTSTTDESSAYYYVYITDPATEQPVITPTTRNFTGTLTYTITPPANWDVYYTIDGSDPSDANNSNRVSLAHGANPVSNTIGEGMAVDASVTVKAIAYNPSDASHTSVVVSETYTKKDDLPDPIFDPDGTKTGGYKYNTSDLTVQIACAYAGSIIYYTIGESSSIDDPVIGAANTYRYSGLSKVTVTGNKYIKAVAYDPVNEIFSNVVTAYYYYSENMDKPYFQVSNDEGSTWWGYNGNTWAQNATGWHSGQNYTIKPSTQIRIIDPNIVKGTIFYTLDGTTPADNATTLVYTEGNPFTVGKTTTGNAITILEDAHSDVASAVFTMASGSYVWEANQYTLTDSVGSSKKGIHIADGFVISTKSDLLSETNNYGTKVNLKSLASGNTANTTFAQEDITATFGGYDLASWEQMTIADAATGAPIGNVGEYSIKNISNTGVGNGNAKDESGTNYNHIYSYKTEKDRLTTDNVTAATTHEKTFRVPAIGGFVRFEPEKDGDLTIWCLQQGALLYEDDKYFIDNVLRIRPVYLVDEQGKSYQVKTVNGVPQLWSSARLSENWTKIQETAANNNWKNSKWIGPGNDDYNKTAAEYVQYVRVSDGKLEQTQPTGEGVHIVDKLSDIKTSWEKSKCYKKLVNKGPNKTETAAIYQMYKADLDKNHVSVGNPIKPFAIHTGSTISLNDNRLKDNSDDGTGYVLASGGFAKYTFEVKAGKTYYFFAQGSKIGIRGFQFVPTEDGTGRHAVTITKIGTTYTVDGDEKTPAEAVAACADKPANVTLSGRTFKADTWASLVLPFSVSVAQVENVFGAHTDIIHFDDIKTWGDAYKLYLKRHWHKMIVAGTPILIKPTQEVTNPVFNGVQLEASAVTDMTASTVANQYMMTGVLVKTNDALKKDDYYINTSGKLTHMTAASNNVNATYAWIKYLGQTNNAKSLTIGITDFEDNMLSDDETTGIQIALLEESGINTFNCDDSVYNLNGMKVGDGSSMQNLPKGIYIVKGKKVIIK